MYFGGTGPFLRKIIAINAPTKNPELARQRQGQVVRKMINQGYLTQEEASKIILVNE